MAINAQELQGQWNNLRGQVKQKWGQLTDDDLQIHQGNVDQLVEATYVGSDNKNHLRKEWEFTTKVAGPHYRFTWKILGYSQQGPNNASVKIEIVRNALNSGAYPEHFDLPLLREGGRWKVRATALSREIFPALPR